MLFLIKSLSTSSELMGLAAKISTLRTLSTCRYFPVGMGERDGAERGCPWLEAGWRGRWQMSSASSSSLPSTSPSSEGYQTPAGGVAQTCLDFGLTKTFYCNRNDLIHQKSPVAKRRGLLLVLSGAEEDHGSSPSCRAPGGSSPAAGRAARRRGSHLSVWPRPCMPNE